MDAVTISARGTAAPRADSLADALYRAYWRTMGIPDEGIDRALEMPDAEGHWDAVADAAIAWLAAHPAERETGIRTARLRAERAAATELEAAS